MEGSGRREEGVWRAENEIAGNRKAIQALRELIVYPFSFADDVHKSGLKWHRGLLLYGPPGTGKTSMVKAIVRECGGHLTMISPHSVHKSYSGESEKFLREAFAKAYSYVSSGKPSVVFIDEIDAICPRRSSRREQETRIVAQLLTLMDGKKSRSEPLPDIVVVASTNRVDGIDPALRRPGHFDSEVEVTFPTMEERLQILELYSKNFQLDDNVDLQAIAASCHGYVGADLEALVREAARFAHRRLSGTVSDGDGATIIINMEDWESARSEFRPSVTKGVTKEVAKVSWDDIGGLKNLKKKLKLAVEWPIKHADSFARLGISPVRGVLLHGPPGCSKTSLAKAATTAAQASFFSLSGADVYSKYVGEGEALLRGIFQKAKLAAPSIIFFDEVDAIAPKRGHAGNSGGNAIVGERLLSTLLNEMDGLEEATGIIVLAATNRPDVIDAALLRPGRFDSVLYVPPPDVEGRHEILRIHTKQMKLGEDVDLQEIAECTDLFTGADLEGLCREAGIAALREDISAQFVCHRHFKIAKDSLRPSLTQAKISLDNFKSGRLHTMVTSSFSHSDFDHLLTNMIGLYFFGSSIAILFGPEFLLKLYLGGALGGSVFYLVHKAFMVPSLKGYRGWDESRIPALGASAAVNAIILLNVFLFPKNIYYVNLIIPVPAALLGAFLIGSDIWRIKKGEGHISGSAHLGGAVVAALVFARIKRWI